ncbi:ATP-binding protein [Streptomyces sp. NPDC005828]|uniref:ATP-binding protein n=1 Tax=Streptomyces sp. NPDC005828 TaxID=3157071 RepID=UPI0033D0C1CE
MGATESNAGDDFHFWWTAGRALELVSPGTELELVTVEGLAVVDDPDEQYETVDVAEYFGGRDVASADRIVLSQLKYSTRHAETAWTAARLCQKRVKKAEGKADSERSVIADLAAAYTRLRDDLGDQALGKARIALVSNCPGAPLLLQSVRAAAQWTAKQTAPTRAALKAALPADQSTVINTLAEATKSRLQSAEFCRFLQLLDLSTTGTMDRTALARAVKSGASVLTPGHGLDSANRLFDLVRQQALPGSSRGGVTAQDVLATLGVADLLDLYPAPSRLEPLQNPLLTVGAEAIAAAVTANSGRLTVAHGEAGVGKTTAMRQIGDHLPAGSQVVLFDCYGAGEYLSAGEERHTPRRFVTQVVNEVAQHCGTPLLVRAPADEGDLWRRLSRTLEQAVTILPDGATLVLAVDAADNSAVAARERDERSFLTNLVRLPLPGRVSVVVSARTHRVPSLRADGAAQVPLPPFTAETSAAHLRRYQPAASDEECLDFHGRSGGNPRAQNYTLEQARTEAWDMATLLKKSERTPQQMFELLLASGLQAGGADAGGERWLAFLLALARPVSMTTLATALDVPIEKVTAFANGLAPGIRLVGEQIQFRDEDFETFVRSRVNHEAVVEAHGRLADLFLEQHESSADAAAHVATHLYLAKRLTELVNLVLAEDSPAGIADGFRREQVQMERLRLAALAVAETGSASEAVRLAARGCDTASRSKSLSELVDSHMDLVARYADVDLLQAYAPRHGDAQWLGPVWMRLAGVLSRDPQRQAETRNALDKASAWVRRWMASQDKEGRSWEVGADDVAAAAEARYRLEGMQAAISMLRRWRPASFVVEVTERLAARLAGELDAQEVYDALTQHRVPAHAQAPVLAHLGSAASPPPTKWVDEVTAVLTHVPATGPHPPWHRKLLDVALRFGDRQSALALAEHWAIELPTSQWAFNSPSGAATITLYSHAASAALSDTQTGAEQLLPASLQPTAQGTGHSYDPHTGEREGWLKRVDPLITAGLLHVRAVLGQAQASDVEAFCTTGLQTRTELTRYRWFTYDREFRAWATMVASAAIETGAPAVIIDRLADAARGLLRGGAPTLWLDLADVLAERGAHPDTAADLCLKAAQAVRDGGYDAADRLELLARSAGIAGTIHSGLGRNLFDQAVDAAAGINDESARLLSVYADLAQRADLSAPDRAVTASRLVTAVEAVTPHVTDASVIPYEEVLKATAGLDCRLGLATASRWDDEDRIALAHALPAALEGAVATGALPGGQALALDHLIDDDARRLAFQITVARHLASAGSASSRAAARTALVRAAKWLRLRVPVRSQPRLASQLLGAAHSLDQEAAVEPELEPVIALTPQGRAGESEGVSATWIGDTEDAFSEEAPATPVSAASWRTLAPDIEAMGTAAPYGHELVQHLTCVVEAAPMNERLSALDTAASLAATNASAVIEALAGLVEQWRTWPGVEAWAKTTVTVLLAEHLPDLVWTYDPPRLARQLRSLGDDATIRNAILRALPRAQTRLTAFGWQTVAVVLGRLCEPATAADALTGLLAAYPATTPAHPEPDESPLPALLWSAFGHPRREIRWRAAHAARELLSHQDHATARPLAEALVACLDRADAAPYRAPALHFYRLSAVTGLLTALHRIARDKPALMREHLAVFIRHATSTDLPHAQIRELARRTALALAPPDDPSRDQLEAANHADRCSIDRTPKNEHGGGLSDAGDRYRFDALDTIPYWFRPLARVFNLPVDTITRKAETWILDKWGLSEKDWWTDTRELRSDRVSARMGHRHGSIPPEESLRLYLEYHSMLAAAGELVDEYHPLLISKWAENENPWDEWLARHVLPDGPWLADLSEPAPAQPYLFLSSDPDDSAWAAPQLTDSREIFGLVHDDLPPSVLVAASMNTTWAGGYENVYVASALVRPDRAEDLQRALAAATEPSDWKLPDEDETEHEVDHGLFELRGWLRDPDPRPANLDEHDPYAQGLRAEGPLPGHAFRRQTHAHPDQDGVRLLADQAVLAQWTQWSDGDPDDSRAGRTTNGSRVHVTRDALLKYLSTTGYSLIVEVQIGRRRSKTAARHDDRRSWLYLIHADGRATVR